MAVLENMVAPAAAVEPPKAASPIVEASDVEKRYDTGKVQVHALRGVSFKVPRGQRVRRFEQCLEIVVAPSCVRLHDFKNGANVFLDAETAKDRGFLRQIADTQTCALIHRQLRNVAAIELDAALIGLDQAGDHVKHRGLTGAVRSE